MLTGIAASLMLPVLLGAAGAPQTPGVGSLKAGAALRVLLSADEAPETFSLLPGARPGFERELIEGFAKVHGLTVQAVPVKIPADRIPALLAGKGDVIVAIFDTEDRRKVVDFTAEVMPTHNVAVT